MTRAEGYVEVGGLKLYYEMRGSGRKNRGTLLCLHGGPGSTHDYLEPLADLTRYGYRVVFYDQMGCGKSELPKDLSFFTVERHVEEVEGIRKALHLGTRIHLMGSSWGGLLAIAYALKYQKNLRNLITTGGLASVPLCVAEMERLRRKLPEKIRRIMVKHERSGDYHNPEYERAVMEFYRRHLCRLPRWPKELLYSHSHISKPVYYTMNGPNEFTIIGTIHYWDSTPELHKIRVPTLVTGGRYDEVTPRVARSIHDGIKGSRMVIFERSSHLPMWEERDKYVETLRDFLSSAS